jgi:hypothetical protein
MLWYLCVKLSILFTRSLLMCPKFASFQNIIEEDKTKKLTETTEGQLHEKKCSKC